MENDRNFEKRKVVSKVKNLISMIERSINDNESHPFARYASCKNYALRFNELMGEAIKYFDLQQNDLGYFKLDNCNVNDMLPHQQKQLLEETENASRDLLTTLEMSLEPTELQLSAGVKLPVNKDSSLNKLRHEIIRMLSEDEPSLALDRLHTFVTIYLRQICETVEISIYKENGDYLPIQSLMGKLVKHLQSAGKVESKFSIQAMKSSISILDSFNAVRNESSFAHANKVLDPCEAKFVIEIVSDILSFIDQILPDHS